MQFPTSIIIQNRKNRDSFGGKISLIFKKYIFLQKDFEKNDWSKDIIRTRLLAYQTFNDVAQAKYPLTFNEYSLVAAFYGFELYGNLHENINFFDCLTKIKRVIPEEIYKQKTHEFWNTMILKKWKKLGEKLEEKQKVDDISQRNMLEMNFIQIMQKNEFFGVTFFETEIYKNNEFPKSVNFLGVKYDGILVIEIEKKEKLLFSQYKDIHKMVVHPKSIIFEFEKKILRFNTCKSFEISQMINIYTKILNFIKE